MAAEIPESTGGGGGNVFTKQIGPLPMWGWMGVALAAALAYFFWHKNKAAATAASPTNTPATTNSSLIPQFVNQVYTGNAPPVEPPIVGPPGPKGSPGPQGPPGTTGNAGQAHQYPAPTGLKVKKLSNTSVQLMWDYITQTMPRPTSYTVAAYSKGKLVAQQTVNAPDTASGQASMTLQGLPKSENLQYHVWANGGSVAPPHASAAGVS